METVEIGCPYCGEWVTLPVDLSQGDYECVEDCPVCCQPMELALVADAYGAVVAAEARRENE